jgi:hypothetical protein
MLMPVLHLSEAKESFILKEYFILKECFILSETKD